MAKGGLFQGADSSLVAAAYRASASTAPKDYFRQFESVSRNYATTMAATANMWGSIIKAGTQIGLAIDRSNRLEAQKSDQIEDMFGTDGAQNIFAKLEGFKSELKTTTGIYKDDRQTIMQDGVEIENPNFNKRVNPFSKETRDNRRKVRKKINDYYASLEKIGTDVNALTTAHTNKLIDETQTPLLAMEWSHAIMQAKNGKSTDSGNRVVLEENEKDDWAFVMYHDPKKITEDAITLEGVPGFAMGKASIDKKGRVLGADGKVIRYSAAEINDLLIPKDNDKNGNSAMQTGLEGFYDGIYKSGNGQELLPHQINEIASFFDKTKTSPKAWKTRNKFGDQGKSFFEEMITPSKASAEAFGGLANIVTENVKALEGLDQNQKAELFSGMKDVPGTSKGINSEDFVGTTQQHADNYKALTLALFNPGHANYNAATTGEVYKKFGMDKVGTIRGVGWENNPKNPANIVSDIDGPTQTFNVPKKGLRLGPMINGQYQQRETQRQVVDFINRLKNGNEIQYQGNEYTFVENNWVQNRGIEGVEEKIIGTTDNMRRDIFQTTDKSFMNIETVVEERIDHTTGKIEKQDQRLEGTFDKTTGLNISDLEQDDNVVAAALNKIIPAMRTEANKEGYHFDITRNMFGIGEFTQDAVVLLDKNNNPVKFPKGHKHAGKEASFYTDQTKEADKQASFNYLMDIMEHFKLNIGGNIGTGKFDDL